MYNLRTPRELTIYVCFMISLAFVAKFVQSGSFIFPETPAQVPQCHLGESNAISKNKINLKNQFQQSVLLWMTHV